MNGCIYIYMLSDDDTILNFSIWTAETGGMWNLPLTPNSCGPQTMLGETSMQ